MSATVPIISVLMGVLNCESTLDESLNCLAEQTETQWECIICDDGSTDQTAAVIRKWLEKYPNKFVFLQNDMNKGLSYTLNRCMAEGKSRMRNFQRGLIEEGLRLMAFPFSKVLDIDHASDIEKAERMVASPPASHILEDTQSSTSLRREGAGRRRDC